MDKIKVEYTDTSELMDIIGKENISKKIAFFIKSMETFIGKFGDEYKGKLILNDKILQHCVMDYYCDILRLKEFHRIEKINDIKRTAYEAYWILRRKPIQVIGAELDDDVIVYANEKYVLTYLMDELLRGRRDDILTDEAYICYKSFANSLYYYLKYRDCDAKVLELMILAFKAGLNYNLQGKEQAPASPPPDRAANTGL